MDFGIFLPLNSLDVKLVNMYKNTRRNSVEMYFAKSAVLGNFDEKYMLFCEKCGGNLRFARFFNGGFVKNRCENNNLSEKMLFLSY